MKSQPCILVSGSGYLPCEPAGATHLKFRMPGPIGTLVLPVMIGGTRDGTSNWTWNGSVDSPTLKPSIKTETWIGKNACYDDGGPSRQCVCHSFLNDGKVQFLDDTTHDLRGQTVELLDLEESDL